MLLCARSMFQLYDQLIAFLKKWRTVVKVLTKQKPEQIKKFRSFLNCFAMYGILRSRFYCFLRSLVIVWKKNYELFQKAAVSLFQASVRQMFTVFFWQLRTILLLSLQKLDAVSSPSVMTRFAKAVVTGLLRPQKDAKTRWIRLPLIFFSDYDFI